MTMYKLIDHIECSFKVNCTCNRVTLRGLIPSIVKQPTQYWSRLVLRNRSSPPTTDCNKIRLLQTALEALLILLSAKPYIFLLLGACLLNSFVCCTVILTEVYPEFTRHLGLFQFKQLAIDFNDNFCCVPGLPVAMWKVTICLLIASDEGNQHEEMARCGTF